MRRRRSSSLVLSSLSGSAVLLALACGGGNEAKSPMTPDPAPSASSEPESASNGTSGPSTTLQVGDGSDQQGTKLESTSSEGAKPSGGSSEPGRSPADLKTIIGGTHRDAARACYDQGLKDHPGIEGDITIAFTIDPQGVVSKAEVDTTKSSILEPSVGACIVDVIKKIKFAPSAKGFETRANYPFNFHPRNTPAKDAGK